MKILFIQGRNRNNQHHNNNKKPGNNSKYISSGEAKTDFTGAKSKVWLYLYRGVI